jgi:hypothetical protein
MKAKVFLSCGQNKNSDELGIAEKIAQRIRELGFDCYMAVAEQSLRSLRENIFAQLESSDYLVFVDFKREELKVAGNGSVFRGSLFSHQELAISSFLEVPVLPLQEHGLKPLDGMMGAMQANAVEFSDRNLLPNVVGDLISQKIRSGEWQTDTRNALSLELANPLFTNANLNAGGTRRFYHIAVRNNHHRKAALYCYVYLDAVVNLNTNKMTRPKTVEFKWSGTLLPDVRIGPKTIREFDGLDFVVQTPIQPRFWIHTDSPDYVPRLDGPGKYRLSYSVVSQNFGSTTCDFILEYGQTPESVVFSKA